MTLGGTVRALLFAALLLPATNVGEVKAGSGTGALIGAGAGIAVGLATIVIAADGDYESAGAVLLVPPLYGVLGAFIGAAAGAQRNNASAVPTGPLSVGDRVRFNSPSFPEGMIVGRIVEADSVSVTIASDSAHVVTIEREDLPRIERSLGHKSHAGTGLVLGATAGALTGIALTQDDNSNSAAVITAPFIMAAAGGLVGAVAGRVVSGEKWQGVTADTRLGLQIGTPRMPLALGVRTSF